MVTFSGGELGTGTARALRSSGEPLHLIGTDAGRFQLHLAEVDERHMVPRGDAPEYIPVLKDLIGETDTEFLWPLHDDEIASVSAAVDLGVRTFIPTAEVVSLCQDKLASYERFLAHDVPVPETMPLDTKDDVASALERFSGQAWLRAVQGAGGKGAYRASDIDDAVWWLDRSDGWGTFTAAEVLTGRQYKWESVWYEGELVAAQTRSYVGIGRFRSMATGASAGMGSRRERNQQLTGAPESVVEVSIASIRAASPKPHGIFSVDTTADDNGVPKVTEINVGRFTSVGAIYWHTQGFNFPHLVLKLAFGEDPGFDTPLINPLPAETYIVQGRNTYPTFVKEDTIKPYDDDLAERIKRTTSG